MEPAVAITLASGWMKLPALGPRSVRHGRARWLSTAPGLACSDRDVPFDLGPGYNKGGGMHADRHDVEVMLARCRFASDARD